jgi:hypothetical protein
MATIVNTPNGSSEDSGLGLILGILLALVLIFLFFVYGLPAIRGGDNPVDRDTTINVDIPNPLPVDDTPNSSGGSGNGLDSGGGNSGSGL